jgi:hypothetical protein
MSLLSFSPLDIIRKGQAMQHATPRIRVLSSPQHATSAFLAFLVAARSRAAATHHEHRPETHGQRFNPSDRDLLALKLWVGAARHLWGGTSLGTLKLLEGQRERMGKYWTLVTAVDMFVLASSFSVQLSVDRGGT